jgi:tetratricopeptide (TPR) repeat protein
LVDALRWDPKNSYALIMVGNIYARFYDDIDTAMNYYDQVIKINPNDNIALNNIGANLMHLKKHDEALIYFQKANKIDPTYPNTYAGIGMVYAEKREYTKAFETFVEGLKTHKKDDELRKHLLGNAYGVCENVISSDLPEIVIGAFQKSIEDKNNRKIAITQDENILGAAKIEYAENYDRNEDLVKYNPNFPAYQHLILHELVHLELMLEARSTNENKLFTTTNKHKRAFHDKLEGYKKELLRKGLKDELVDNLIDDFFNGLNSQIFNAAPDLFIEDRIYKRYPEFKPVQFVSLYNLIQNGIKAVTQKEIVDLADSWVLSRSKILNLVNAIQFRELFGLDFTKHMQPSKQEMDKAQAFYEEFLEYKDDKLPAEEYELVENWGKDLGLDTFYDLLDENEFRSKDDFANNILDKIIEDPFDLNSDQEFKTQEMEKFLKKQKELGLNTAVAMYMVDAINYFNPMSKEQIKEIAFEIAMQGTQGYNPELKYRLNSIPNIVFSGYKILAYYYVSWALAIPEMLKELKLPFDDEYKLAQTLSKS